MSHNYCFLSFSLSHRLAVPVPSSCAFEPRKPNKQTNKTKERGIHNSQSELQNHNGGSGLYNKETIWGGSPSVVKQSSLAGQGQSTLQFSVVIFVSIIRLQEPLDALRKLQLKALQLLVHGISATVELVGEAVHPRLVVAHVVLESEQLQLALGALCRLAEEVHGR